MSDTKLPTVQELAAQVSDAFIREKRNDGSDFYKLRDGSPEWMTDLCHIAHADMMPDDWRYEFIQDVVVLMENGDGIEGIDIDSLYPYTNSRLQWLASRLDRMGYCDEALSDYGSTIDKIETAIALGMHKELEEVYGLVESFLKEREQQLEDEADDMDEEESDDPIEAE